MRSRFHGLVLVLLSCGACAGTEKSLSDAAPPVEPLTLLDLSGLTWIEGDEFLGVHDAKDNAEKHNWPRVSRLRLPQNELDGVLWTVVPLEFPGPPGRGSDLESACSIPGGRGFLICESGQEGVDDRRIFHLIQRGDEFRINSYITWPNPVENVEATEVCEVGGQLFFLYAERADSKKSTLLRWAPLTLNPLALGEFQELPYEGVDPVGDGARPIVALDIDDQGWIYSVSAYDSGSDDGPYRSVVWRIGRIVDRGRPRVVLEGTERIATIDGLKVESVTVRHGDNGVQQIYVGTDDEHYGGILRLLPDQRPVIQSASR